MAISKFFSKLKAGLVRTAQALGGGLRSLVGRKVDRDFLKELESKLIGADVGVEATDEILKRVEEAYANKEAGKDLIDFVKNELKAMLKQEQASINFQSSGPTVVMVAGVNGSGKTTSIAKLGTWLMGQGKSVILGAGDTYRAAAVEQLDRWAQRIGAEIVKGKPGGDPAAVAYDACQAALSRNKNVAIVDTAGRLHTQIDLMRELEKIHRVIGKAIPGAPHEVLLVLDATNGQNAILQAANFTKAVKCTGVILAKLDGTAKGGAIVAIRKKLGLPVKFVGLGEKPDDFALFDPDEFIDSLFED
jgi:fused signal recognition particle receptor